MNHYGFDVSIDICNAKGKFYQRNIQGMVLAFSLKGIHGIVIWDLNTKWNSVLNQTKIDDMKKQRDSADIRMDYKTEPKGIFYYSYEPMREGQRKIYGYCEYLKSDSCYRRYSIPTLHGRFLFDVMATLGSVAMWDYMANLYMKEFSMIIKKHNSTEGKNCPHIDNILTVLYYDSELIYEERIDRLKETKDWTPKLSGLELEEDKQLV